MKVLINVTYASPYPSGYWSQSYLKNTVIDFDPDNPRDSLNKALKGEYHSISKSAEFKAQFTERKDGSNPQTGVVVKVSTEIQNDVTGKWVKVYFDAWITISEIKDFDFDLINSKIKVA